MDEPQQFHLRIVEQAPGLGLELRRVAEVVCLRVVAELDDAEVKILLRLRVERGGGAHGDVGGGYPDGKLQQIPLRWIQQKAQACGLQFAADVQVADDAYLGTMHDSYEEFMWGLYRFLPGTSRLYRPLGTGVKEAIDESVHKRMQTPGATDERGEPYSPPQMTNGPK